MSLRADVRCVAADFVVEASIEAERGRPVALVGPNGAGKTTLLRVLAGLAPIERGTVTLDGMVLDDDTTHVPSRDRSAGVVFQDRVLFDTMSAIENVAFGLRARGMRKGDANARARVLLERLGLESYEHAKPHALSGGQAQRVALARALAVEPRALLLDEPLAALDARTRVDVRRMLHEQLAAFDGARVLVTHDPLEALTLGDRIVVIEAGQVVQAGTPDEIRRHPRSPYVAALLGVNLLAGRLAGDGHLLLDDGGELLVTAGGVGDAVAIIDPSDVTLFRTRPEGSARNCWRAVVHDVDRAPDRVRVHFAEPFALVADVTPGAQAELALAPGTEVWCAVKATAIEVHAR